MSDGPVTGRPAADETAADEAMADQAAADEAMELRLRQVLEARAETASPAAGDRGDLDRRMARSARRRRRALSSVAAVVVVLGVAGGFAGGLATGRGHAPAHQPGKFASPSAPHRGAASGPAEAQGGEAEGLPSAGGAQSAEATSGTSYAASRASSATGCSSPAPPVASADRVLVRTNRAGVTERAYRTVSGGSEDAGLLTVELSTPAAVGIGSFALHPAVAGSGAGASSVLGGTSGTFGVGEGSPVQWVAVQVGSSVASVRVVFADGSTDAMAPVGGIAVLAQRVPAGRPASTGAGAGGDASAGCQAPVTGTVQILDPSGVVRSSEPVASLPSQAP